MFKTKFWNCSENLENKNAKWCILPLFKPISVRTLKDTFHAMDWTNCQ